jgi:hypothetical protein
MRATTRSSFLRLLDATLSRWPAVTGPAAKRLASVEPKAKGVDATFARLDEEIDWYDSKSVRQRFYKTLKVAELLAAAAIPVIASADAPIVAAGVLGAIVVVLEGIQHLNQYRANWTAYRSTCEAPKHEKYLFLAGAGPYAGERSPSILAERVESLISQEHARWISVRKESERESDQPA